MKRLASLLLGLALSLSAQAAPLRAVSSGAAGAISPSQLAPQANNTVLGNISGSAASPSAIDPTALTIIPDGATPDRSTLAKLAAAQGVLLDTFYRAGDADDTASFTRAVTAGVAIVLGPREYLVNGFSSGAVANFVLRGIPGKSIVRRVGSTGSSPFTIGAANVYIDGVIFDMDKDTITANQWPVLISKTTAKNVTVRNSVFKDNSGSLGACLAIINTSGTVANDNIIIEGNEFTGCQDGLASLYLGTVANVTVANNYIHDNALYGMSVSAYLTASSTNYSKNVVIANNKFIGNTSAGLIMGGFGPPYALTPAPLVSAVAKGNNFQDNGVHALVQGHYLIFSNNTLTETAPAVAVTAAVYCNSKYSLIESNYVSLSGASYGIDCGGSIETSVRGNTVAMDSGSAINIGGTVNDVVSGNTVSVSGTGQAVSIQAGEGDGSGNYFPTVTDNLTIYGNTIRMNGVNSRGITAVDNAGGFGTGVDPIQVVNNYFLTENSASDSFTIDDSKVQSTAIRIQGNTVNNKTQTFADPDGSGIVAFPDVYDQVTSFSSTATVTAITPFWVNNYKAGSSVLWINPTAGGSSYSASTTISITGGACSGVAATPIINSGVIVAVKITAGGNSCTSNPTVAAVDGTGSGATFNVSRTAQIPRNRRIVYQTIGGTINGSGGNTTIGGGALPFTPNSGYAMELLATGTLSWRWLNPGSTNGASGDLLRSNGAGSFTTSLTPATGIATFLATPSSANAKAALTDELDPSGAGLAVFSPGGLNVTTAKTLTVSNSLTLAGTDSTTMTFPSTSATIDSGTGTTNTLSKWTTGASGIQGNSQITDDGTTITLPGAAVNISATTLQRSGNTVLMARRFTATYDPASLAGATAREDTVTVTGITTAGGAVSLNIPSAMPAGCVIANVYASAADTVKVDWQNSNTVTACDVASSTAVFTQAQ